jgi:hypothetical protein
LEGAALVRGSFPCIVGVSDNEFPCTDPSAAVSVGESFREGGFACADRAAYGDDM